MSAPPEWRRRSPSASITQPGIEEQSTASMHPFLDLEKANPRTTEPSSRLLAEWVPGIPEPSQKLSEQKVPYAYSAGISSAVGPDLTAKKRSSRRLTWSAVTLAFLILTGILYLVLHGRKGRTVSAPLEALGTGEGREDFVRVQGTQFMLDCRPFYVAGFNAHDLVPKALATTSEHKTYENREGKELVEEMLRNASSIGLNVARVYAHTTDHQHPFQTSPGVYEEDALRAMDFVMESARKLGMKVMLSFADNWKFQGGIDQMLNWSKTVEKRTQERPADKNGDFNDEDLPVKVKEYEVGRHSLFYNDTDSRNIYKNYVKAIITRENSINGRKYSEDPTLMSWALLNEPRCETWRVPECKQTFQAWVVEMSSYVKSLDPTHLVTIGSEGFFGEESIQAKHNPQSWGSQIGQDFTANHMPSSIDYLTVHMWPDNWQRPKPSYQQEWLQAHMDVAKKTLKKPLLLEEFGKKLVAGDDSVLFEQAIDRLRNPVFETTFRIVEKALDKGQPLQGSMFWRWDLIIYEQQARADYGVRLYDTTMNLIKSHAAYVTRWQASQPPAATCGLECWVPNKEGNSCSNTPKVCSSQLKSKKKSGRQLTYPTRTACCRPGTGAFPAGCAD